MQASAVAPSHLFCATKLSSGDASQAPDVGRSYELLATASRDKTLKMWRLRRATPREEGLGGGLPTRGGPPAAAAATELCQAKLLHELPHDSQVWRCEFNAVGTMLACSIDEGAVHIYNQDEHASWQRCQIRRHQQ